MVSDKVHDLLIKLIAIVIGIQGLFTFFGAFGADGVFGVLFTLLLGVVILATAVGIWRYRGWAFLLVSVVLLFGFLYYFVEFIRALDGQGSVSAALTMLILDIVFIGYFGRWSMERRFRPHLDHH